MKYQAKHLENNHNVSNKDPLLEFFKLIAGLILIIIFLVLIVDVSIRIFAKSIPISLETNLRKKYEIEEVFDKKIKYDPKKFQEIANKMGDSLGHSFGTFRISIIESDNDNAFAFFGNNIILFSGLIDQAKSENEIAMIIGHEIGHLINRDHIRRLGTLGLVSFAYGLAFGNELDILDFVINLTYLGYSRSQEEQADLLGLKLLNQYYGHVGGATDYFERIKNNKLPQEDGSFFSTHPYSGDRIKAINKYSEKNSFKVGIRKPLQIKDSSL